MQYIYFETKDGKRHAGVLLPDGRAAAAEALVPGFSGSTLLDLIRAGEAVQAELCAAAEKSSAAMSDAATENRSAEPSPSAAEKGSAAAASAKGQTGACGAAAAVHGGAEIYAAADIRLLAPIEYPAHDILCVGVNYADHLKETQEHLDGSSGLDAAKAVYFSKRANRIIGPEETLRARFDLDPCLDYEAELAVIIGREGKDIAPEEAERYIFGYSVFNDLSSRSLQSAHAQWFKGKSLDGYSAMGPVVVSSDALRLPFSAAVTSRVNGELRQHSNTRLLIHGVCEIIAELSAGMKLYPGDIIATGTPAGVGMGFTPPRFMKAGDTVECEIEGIGCLRNHIAAEK